MKRAGSSTTKTYINSVPNQSVHQNAIMDTINSYLNRSKTREDVVKDLSTIEKQITKS